MIETCPKCQSRNIRFIKNSIDEKICDDCCYYGRMIFRSELRDTIAENWFPPTFKTLGYQPTMQYESSTIPAAPLGRSNSMPLNLTERTINPIIIKEAIVTLGSLKRTGNRIVRDNIKKNSIVIDIKRRF